MDEVQYVQNGDMLGNKGTPVGTWGNWRHIRWMQVPRWRKEMSPSLQKLSLDRLVISHIEFIPFIISCFGWDFSG